ncbi:MAG: oligosaccharide flippase family protein [Butyrivibrio sp.]|nr:oligosaccharide flippase family protein [Butyrivibrio sp.]
MIKEPVKYWVEKYRGLSIYVKASMWFLVCTFIQKAVSVISTPIFTRIMTSAEYGVYGVFASWLDIVTVFVTLNLFLGMYTSRLVKYGEMSAEFTSSMQGLCMTLEVFWCIVYLIFRDAINGVTSLTTTQTILLFVMMWSSSAYNFWAVQQRVNLSYRSLVLVTVASSILKPMVGVILVVNAQDKVTARIFGLAVVQVVFFTGCFISQMRKGKVFFSRRFWGEALLFNIPLIPHYLSMSVLNSIDKIMIEKMIGKSEAGIYNLAYSVALLVKIFNMALSQTIEPWIYKKIKESKAQEIGKIAYTSMIIIAVLNLGLMALAPEAVMLFAPKSYYDAIWIIPPVATSVFFMFMYMFFASFEFYYSKTVLIAIATCIGAGLNIVLNYIFIGMYGYYAAGYTTLICYIVYALVHYIFMKKVCKANYGECKVYDTRIIVMISVVFMACGVILLMTYKMRGVRYLIIAISVIMAAIFRNRIKETVDNILRIKKGTDT